MGKFTSLRSEVVYRATLDGTGETFGDVDAYGMHMTLVEDFYGRDYLVTENSVGFVDVHGFDNIDIDATGYYQPARRQFDTIAAAILAEFGDDDGDDN